MRLNNKDHIAVLNYIIAINLYMIDELNLVDTDFNNKITTDISLYALDYHLTALPFLIIVHALGLLLYEKINKPSNMTLNNYLSQLIPSVLELSGIKDEAYDIIENNIYNIINIEFSSKRIKSVNKYKPIYNTFPTTNSLTKITMFYILLLSFTKIIINSLYYATLNNSIQMIIENNNMLLRLFSGGTPNRINQLTISDALVISISEGLLIPVHDSLNDETYMQSVIIAGLDKLYDLIKIISKSLDYESHGFILTKKQLLNKILAYSLKGTL